MVQDKLGYDKFSVGKSVASVARYSNDYSRFANLEIDDDDDNMPKAVKDQVESLAKVEKLKAELEALEKQKASTLKGLGPLEAKVKEEKVATEDVEKNLDNVKTDMNQHLESLQKQMDKLKYHEETVAMLSNPMEMAKYLEAQGVAPKDIEAAIHDGDEGVMLKMLEKQLGMEVPPTGSEPMQDTLQKIDDLTSIMKDKDFVEQSDTPSEQASKETRSSFSFYGTRSKSQKPKTLKPADENCKPEQPKTVQYAEQPARAPQENAVKVDKASSLPVHRIEESESNLVVSIELPGLRGMADVVLEVEDSELSFVSSTEPKYDFKLPFPRQVQSESAVAKFSRKHATLKITIPLTE